MSHLVDIIIPSLDNRAHLEPCLATLLRRRPRAGLLAITVVNNGRPDACDWIDDPLVQVLQTGGVNLGWEGGLQAALEQTGAPFVCFLNDDTLFPAQHADWLERLLRHFDDPAIGAVGPASNVVSGFQRVALQAEAPILNAKFLIGFCMLLRREALERAGGIDTTLPGGDDLDISLRLRAAGYTLLIDREVFVHHVGFQTGTRVHGGWNTPMGWNSYLHTDRTNEALIVKHGWRTWWELQLAYRTTPPAYQPPAR